MSLSLTASSLPLPLVFLSLHRYLPLLTLFLPLSPSPSLSANQNFSLPSIGPYQTLEASYPFNFTNVPIFQFNSSTALNDTSGVRSEVLGSMANVLKSTVLFEVSGRLLIDGVNAVKREVRGTEP